jgi:hypothetical protein
MCQVLWEFTSHKILKSWFRRSYEAIPFLSPATCSTPPWNPFHLGKTELISQIDGEH